MVIKKAGASRACTGAPARMRLGIVRHLSIILVLIRTYILLGAVPALATLLAPHLSVLSGLVSAFLFLGLLVRDVFFLCHSKYLL